MLEQLRSEGYITGWRDELYPVVSSFYDQPVMLVERAAATHLGIKAYGVHGTCTAWCSAAAIAHEGFGQDG